MTLNQPVTLSYSAATYVQENYQTVTLIVALIATFLSVCSMMWVFCTTLSRRCLTASCLSLYAGAIRYALARSLAGTSTTLYVIFASIQISKATPIKNVIRPSWTVLSLLCALSVHFQTAGYSPFCKTQIRSIDNFILRRFTALLLPKPISLPTIMLGTELDMSSPPFQALMVANAAKLVPGKYILVSRRPF